jgi:hypothetical protein
MLRESYQPLVDHLRLYDDLRLKMEQHGGSLSDLQAITSMLQTRIPVNGPTRAAAVALTDPTSVQRALDDVSRYTLHLQVRRDTTGLPLYYLARIAEDYWCYQLVAEDLYLSPGYPADDERFVQFMTFSGHERQYLRLSPLRERTAVMLGEESSRSDELLLKVGRHVLSAAWHSDQRISASLAHHLRAPEVLHAVELLYLVLSGDLSSIRDEIARDPLASRFFEDVYPQPAILRLLTSLPHSDGSRLADLPRRALQLYAALTADFNRFLRTPVQWQGGPGATPFFKLVLANWRRLHVLEPLLQSNPTLLDALAAFVRASRSVSEALLGAQAAA